MMRHAAISLALALAPALLASGPQAKRPSAPLDVLITGGEVLDGSGGPVRHVDVGVRGNRIVLVAARGRRTIPARQTIDARGLIVAPGFIDPHTHSEPDLVAADPQRRAALNHIMQGVTSVVVGNDGDGSPDMAAAFARLAAGGGPGVNVARYVGFGAVRRSVIGDAARAPTAVEQAAMRKLVSRAMCQGALGLSTGLYYAPQSFAATDEVIDLAREAAARGGIYDTHLRDEGSETVGLFAAVDEALRITREAGLPLHIAHLKLLGVDVHGQAPRLIARLEQAQTAGQAVTADQYPWTASGTNLANALVPRWAHDGGRQAMVARLGDPALATRLREGMADNLRRRGGGASLLLVGGAWRGKRLSQVAEAWGITPLDAAIRILREGDPAPVASFNMDAGDVAMIVAQPWVVAGSDATDGHPRRFGSFAKRWQDFVRARPVLTPAAFVARASGETARQLGLKDRGILRVGAYADIAVFDPQTYAAQADYETPEKLASGMRWVLVNGRIAVAAGQPTYARAGLALPKPRQTNWSCP